MADDFASALTELAGSPAPGALSQPQVRSAVPQGAAPKAPSGGTAAPPLSTQPQSAPPAKSPGVVQSVFHLLNPFAVGKQDLKQDADTLKGAAAGVLRAPGQLVGGLLDTAADAGKFVDSSAAAPFVRQYLPAVEDASQALQQNRKGLPGASYAAALTNRYGTPVAGVYGGKVGNPNVNQFAAEATGAAAPGVGVEGLAAKGAAMAAGGFAAMSADPNHPLASRLQNAAIAGGTELGLGAIGEALGQAAKAARPGIATTVAKATPQEAVADALDKGFAVGRTEEARTNLATQDADPQAANDAPSQEVAQPTRHDDIPPPVEGTPKGSVPAEVEINQGTTPDGKLIKDANAALDKAGAAERLPEDGTHEVSPDGRLIVAPETKAAVDQTPYGRAFAADNESPADPVIYKETDPDGGQRIVYRSTPEDLHGFLKQADHYQANPDQINIRPGDPAYDSVGQWNLGTLGEPENVAPIARALADQFQGPKRVITDDEARQFAAQVGETPEVFSARLAARSEDGTATLKDAITAKVLAAKANGDIASLRTRDWSTVDASHPDFDDALRIYHNGLIHAQSLQMTKADIARGLRIFGVDVNNGFGRSLGIAPEDGFEVQHVPDFEDYKRAFKAGKDPSEMSPVKDGDAPPLPRTPEEFQDAIDLHKVAEEFGPRATAKYWQGKTFRPDAWKYLRTSLANWFSASIVSAPSTYARDLIGPAILGGLQTIERTGGGYAAALKEATIGDATKVPDLLASARQAPGAYLRTMGDLTDSLKAAVSYVRGQSDGIAGHTPNPLDFNTQGVPQALIDAARGDGQNVSASLYTLGNLINKWPQVVHKLHGGVNELAVRQSYLGSVRSGAMLEATQQGLQGQAFWDHVGARVQGAEDPIGFPMDDPLYAASHNNALRTTYTKKVGDAEQPIVNSLNDFVQTMRSEVPESRYILPIFTVPANAIGEVLRRTPLGAIFKGTQRELSGELGASAQAEAYGRFLSGGAITLGGFTMARNGLLTGAGPENPADRALWQKQGMQPYSIKIGGNWYSYNRLDVAGAILGMVGGAYDHTVYHDEGEGVSQHVLATVAATAEYLKDQSALKGVSDLLSFGGSPGEGEGKLRMMGDDIARGFVPNFITQLARNNTDHIQRMVRNPWDAIKNALPGTSTTLDPQRDLWGQDVYKAQQIGPGGTLPITMSAANTYQKDPEVDEMDRLMQKTGYAPGVLQPAIHGAHADMRDIKLEDGHSMYDAVSRYRGLIRNDEGDTLHEAIHNTINSEEYQQGVDGREEDQGSRTQMLSKVFQQFTKQAKEEVAKDSPTAARWMAAATLKQGDSAVLGAHSAQELASPQGETLMRSLGIDYDAALDKVKGQ